MLNDNEWKQFEKLVDGEYMTQVDDAGMEAALEGVKLALLVANHSGDTMIPSASGLIHIDSLKYLHKFGNWRKLPLSQEDRALILKWNDEEDE